MTGSPLLYLVMIVIPQQLDIIISQPIQQITSIHISKYKANITHQISTFYCFIKFKNLAQPYKNFFYFLVRTQFTPSGRYNNPNHPKYGYSSKVMMTPLANIISCHHTNAALAMMILHIARNIHVHTQIFHHHQPMLIHIACILKHHVFT